MTWNPNVPGTKVSRLELLRRMQFIYRDPGTSVRTARVLRIIELAELNILATGHIAAVCRCSQSLVGQVLRENRPDLIVNGKRRGRLDPQMLDTLYSLAAVVAGEGVVTHSMLRELTGRVSPQYIYLLTGVPKGYYNSYMKQQREAAKRKALV